MWGWAQRRSMIQVLDSRERAVRCSNIRRRLAQASLVPASLAMRHLLLRSKSRDRTRPAVWHGLEARFIWPFLGAGRSRRWSASRRSNVPAALSKGSPPWYIRPAPDGLCPGLPSKEAI